MFQATLALNTPTAQSCDPTGFALGWDHAHHGLVPLPGLMLGGSPVCQGWLAAKAVFGRRTLSGSFAVRQWLQLRTLAWRQGIAYEALQLTPNYLSQLRVDQCPVLRIALGGVAGSDSAPVITRLHADSGFAAGHLAMLSQRAAVALAQGDVRVAVRRARAAEQACQANGTRGPVAKTIVADGLDVAAWWRLATLRAFVTPMPFFEAARLPLAVLPPNRVRLLNAVQGLQALVTMQFVSPGWSARVRALAQMLPEHSHRHDFYLFIGALAPRALEADGDPLALRRALEDAWLQERVQRRWQHFVLSLGEAAVASLLDHAAARGLAGVRTLWHAADQATEGWGLHTTDLGLPSSNRAKPIQPAHAALRWAGRRRSAAATGLQPRT